MAEYNTATKTYVFLTDETTDFLLIPLNNTEDRNVIGNAFNNKIIGNDFKNSIDGGKGDDYLDGGAGLDTLIGGLGNDYFVLSTDAEVITENSNEGTDTVEVAFTYSLSNTYLENIVMTGNAEINGTGNNANNAISGNVSANSINGAAGNDVLDGMGGNDTLEGGIGHDRLIGGIGTDSLVGGVGNDTYEIDAADTIVENAGEGNDTVITDINGYFLKENFENLTLIGTAITGLGNTANNVLIGNAEDNTLEGREGRDTLNGGAGADALNGGNGDDTYIIDATDTINEVANEGTDVVEASFSHALQVGSNLENLRLTGTGNFAGTGNELSNYIRGNSGNNALSGGAGYDILDGGAGADYMAGGADSDTFIIDSAGDVVVEAAGEGSDLVVTLISYTLGANLEKLESAHGLFDISLTGNALGNRVTGSDGANRIDGGLGADQMEGEGGNDTFIVDNALDTVTELAGEGKDTVLTKVSFSLGAATEVEILTAMGSGGISLTGSNTANTLKGNAGKNKLTGLAGNDTLDGGAGADVLTGGKGRDNFVFSAKLSKAAMDRIADFSVTDDSVWLDDKQFKTIGKGTAAKPTKLKKNFFVTADKAQDADDRIIYDKAKGILYYDADGSGTGAAVEIASLKKGLKLTAADFFVV